MGDHLGLKAKIMEKDIPFKILTELVQKDYLDFITVIRSQVMLEVLQTSNQNLDGCVVL